MSTECCSEVGGESRDGESPQQPGHPPAEGMTLLFFKNHLWLFGAFWASGIPSRSLALRNISRAEAQTLFMKKEPLPVRRGGNRLGELSAGPGRQLEFKSRPSVLCDSGQVASPL